MSQQDEMRKLINLVEGKLQTTPTNDRVLELDRPERAKFTALAGRLRHSITDVYIKLIHTNKNDPKSLQNLKYSINQLGQTLKYDLSPYDMKGGLWADNPTKELRLINDRSLSLLINNPDYFYKAIDNKNLELVKEELIAAEQSLLEIINSIYKAMGDNSVFKSFILK